MCFTLKLLTLGHSESYIHFEDDLESPLGREVDLVRAPIRKTPVLKKIITQ